MRTSPSKIEAYLCASYWCADKCFHLHVVGSLTVQIFGSSSPSNCNEDEKRSKKADQKLELNKQNGFSTSPAAVTSREDVPNLLKK